MSLSAKRYGGRFLKSSLKEALFEEGFKYEGKILEDIFQNSAGYKPWDLSQSEAEYICENKDSLSIEEIFKRLPRKSRGARWMIRRLYFNSGEVDLKTIIAEWVAIKELRNWEAANVGLCKKLDVDASKLLWIGITFSWQADRFCQLYEKVFNERRPWGSCYQVKHQKVKAVALTPNYNKLPLWVKKVLVNSGQWIQGGSDCRVGNIWRLVDCAKAWKHAPGLPKGVAEKVGRLSPRSRMLSRFAWEKARSAFFHSFAEASSCNWQRSRSWDEQNPIPEERKEIILSFWKELRRLSSLPLMSLAEKIPDSENGYIFSKIAEKTIGLPNNCLESIKKSLNKAEWAGAIASSATPSKACKALLGVTGKLTISLFTKSNQDNRNWASAIAFGNADAIQKILSAEVIGWQPEAVEFLKSLPLKTAVKLLSAKTFKHRGEIYDISSDYIRDTGYLWENIQEKPDLGRIRCWFSTHERLSAAYVREMPDEPLPVHPDWARVHGLASIDGAWEIEIPKRVATLKYYGEMLTNCVGAYGNAIKSGRSIILVVREKGILTHCVEVANGRISQFYQKKNTRPKPEIENSVCAALRQAKLIY